MIQFVQSNQVTNVNGEDWAYPANPNGTQLQIPCSDSEIIGSYWRIPQSLGNRVIGYQYQVDNQTPNPPTPDSIKILRVKLTNTAGITQVDFAIVNTDHIATTSPPNQYAYLCDGVGGTLPVMPTVTIPYPILQTPPQITDNAGDNTFIFPFPANTGGLEYQMNSIWLNGAAPTPAYVAAGITTVAGVVTYANAHWGIYGTWSNPSTDILQLYSPVGATQQVANAGMNVQLAPVNFCFNLTAYSTPANVNQVKFGTGPLIPFPNGAWLLTNNNVTLMNQLVPVMASQTVFSTSVSHKLNVLTVQDTPKLYFNGSLVVASTAGACS